MKDEIPRINVILAVTVIIALVCAGVSVAAKEHLQLRQAQETLPVLKILASIQKRTMKTSLLEKEYYSFKELDVFYLSYQANDYIIDLYRDGGAAYIYVYPRFSLYADIPHILYMDVMQDKIYCLAYNGSGAAKKLCAKLGGIEVGSSERILPDVIKQNALACGEYSAYYLQGNF